jgi:Skp family chaperone for outer membrane proteins
MTDGKLISIGRDAIRVIKLPDLPITDDHCFHASVNPVQKNQVTDQIAVENTSLQESLPDMIENLRQELDKKRNELNRIVEELAALHDLLREKDDLVNEKDIEIEKLEAAMNQLVDHIERTCKTGIVQRTTFLDNNRQTYIKSLPIGSYDTYKVEENDDSTITMEENDDSTITMDSFSSFSVTF